MPHRSYIRQGAFWGLLVFISLAFVGLLEGFLLTIFWAVLLATLFYRPFRLLRWRLRGRSNLAAALTTLLILLLVVLPVVVVLLALVDQSLDVYQRLESGEWNIAVLVDYVQRELPRLQGMLAKIGLTPERMRTDLTNFALTATRTAADQALSYTQNAIAFTAQFFLMLYMLYFFIRDGRQIVHTIINALPFGNEWETIIFARFASVARATLKGTLTVAVIQGSIGGILFATVGIPGAMFWGVVMTLLSLLPIGGSAIVWFPAALILFAQGSIASAIAIIIVGALGIGLIDNVLRPILVGRDTQMPDYLVLLSTLGGLAWFGLSGFVLGPVVAALFLTCWEVAGRDYGGRDS